MPIKHTHIEFGIKFHNIIYLHAKFIFTFTFLILEHNNILTCSNIKVNAFPYQYNLDFFKTRVNSLFRVRHALSSTASSLNIR